jgi:hypothetical protein
MVLKQLRCLGGLLILSIITACTPRQRATKIEDVPRELRVTLSSGIQSEDRSRSDLIYEITGCGATAKGEKVDNQVVMFKSKDFRPDLTCALTIKNFALADDKSFHWAAETGPGVLYQAKKLSIIQAVDGRLIATAVLQQLYSLANPAFTAKLFIEFPAAEPGRPVTGKLQCSPTFVANGTFEEGSGNLGVLTFAGNLTKDSDEYQCKTVIVWVNGEAKYSGFLAAGNPVAVVLSKAAPNIKIVDTPIALSANVEPGTGGIRVVTKPGGPCGADEVFDIEAGRCVKR